MDAKYTVSLNCWCWGPECTTLARSSAPRTDLSRGIVVWEFRPVQFSFMIAFLLHAHVLSTITQDTTASEGAGRWERE